MEVLIIEKIYEAFLEYFKTKIDYVYSDAYNGPLEKDTVIQRLFRKQMHSFRVVELTIRLCESENIPSDIRRLSIIASLFHDIGRFNQVIRYGHFKDHESFDHGELSQNITKDILRNMVSEEDLKVICTSISNHNKLFFDERIPYAELLVSQILRDCDKLQILIINYKGSLALEKITYDNTYIFTEECVNTFLSKKCIDSKNVKTILDNRLKCASWIFDFNFSFSKKFFKEEEFMEILLPERIDLPGETSLTLLRLRGFLIKYVQEEAILA